MHFGINQERLNIITENQIKEVEDALSILLKKKLKVSFKPSDLTETPFEFEKIKSQKESKQAEDDLKKDSSLNEMLEKFDGENIFQGRIIEVHLGTLPSDQAFTFTDWTAEMKAKASICISEDDTLIKSLEIAKSRINVMIDKGMDNNKGVETSAFNWIPASL